MTPETASAFGTLLLNVSLLVAFAHAFSLYSRSLASMGDLRRQLWAGLATGTVSVALMLTPYHLSPGIQFDVRSVGLALAGLFFGPVTAVVAAAMASAFRLYLGGVAAWTGVGVIWSAAALGFALRRAWRGQLSALRWWHLLALGVVVHTVMLLWMLTIGGEGPRVVRAIALPVLTIHALATVLVGLSLVNRLRLQAQEEHVVRQEQLFRLLAEHSQDAIYRYELAPQPRFTYVSPSITRLIGFTPEEHYADPELAQRIVVEADRPLMRGLADQPAGARTPVVIRWRHKDGHVVWTEQVPTAVRDATGAVVAIEGTVRDVTAREEAAARLREREEAYRLLFDAHPLPLWVYDLETLRVLAVNEAAMKQYGYSREEFLALTIADLRPPEDLPALLETVAAVREGRGSHAGTWRHRTRAGRLLDVDITSHLITFSGRRAELVLARDVTADRVAQLERERLFTAIEQYPDSVVITNRAGLIEYVNPAFERASGYSRAEVLGQNPRVLKSGQQDPEFYRALWATIVDGRTWTGRLINRRKDGSPFTEDVSISPVRDTHGAIVSFVAVKRDVSKQLELEAQYLQSQKMEGIGRLAAGVAHDFNNLLTVINSTAELVAFDAPPGSPLAEDLAEIRAAGQRGAALTRQLLAFSRQQVTKPVVLSPDEVLTGFEKLLRRLMSEDVRLEVHPGAATARVLADPGQLEQIVLNLALNARDAIKSGGLVHIETARVPGVPPEGPALRPRTPPGPCLRLSVRDTGTGMTPEVLARIFTPFFTTKDVGKGTGLGLSTVLRLVDEAQGGLRVHSELGRGSTFEVYLPCVDEPTAAAPTALSEAKPEARGLVILLVEDDDMVRPLASRVLEKAGYRVVTATHGREALELVAGGVVKPDLVVTDVVMPELGGPELAEALAPLVPGVPLLFVSGYAPRAETPLPAERFLAKPYSAEALLAAVRRLLEARRTD